MSSDITSVGEPDKDDFQANRSLADRMWRDSWYCNFASRLFPHFNLWWAARSKNEELEPAPVDQPWHGLPEAELTKEQRREAAERLSRE